LFEDGIHGTLMDMRKSNQTRLGFVVWFPFVRDHMKAIREGSLVAVRNFASDSNEDHYSVMRITSVMPTHYAMMAGKDGYPGFVEEAAISASKDWNQDRPIEDTTKIVCDAVPSQFEIRRSRSMDTAEPEIASETNMPMPGERVRLIDPEWTKRIINHDLQKQDGVIEIGTLANSKDVGILALWDSMIRTHFGVFAYTNAGKSNLLSTLASKIFESDGTAKAVVYDLMSEYGILLVDVLYRNDHAHVLFLSPDAVPRSVLEFWKDSTQQNAFRAATDIVRTTVLPKNLTGKREMFVKPMQKMLLDGKFKIRSSEAETLTEHLKGIIESNDGSEASNKFVELLKENANRPLTVDNVNALIKTVEGHDFGKTSHIKASNLQSRAISRLQHVEKSLAVVSYIDQKFKISFNELISDLNQSNSGSLYIIQDTNDVRVREFSKELGEKMLSDRRSEGIISPPVSFIYDEADQFIAQDDKPPGMKESKLTAEQLARRGRKYGLGIGIATQRIVYLDTNILGQPHTYFVSKLPRASDREKIQEAFGLSDETLQESLRFGVGQWLLISHSATGIDGLPVPVHMEDANKRIEEFLSGADAR